MKTKFSQRYGVSRRKVLHGLAAGTTACLVPSHKVWAAETSFPTPTQTEGPFYPRSFPDDIDANLLQFGDNEQLGQGRHIQVFGRVFDVYGEVVSGATVELWQCDRFGTYHHSRGTGRIDQNFQGFGRTSANRDGEYLFQTIKPAPYTGRTPHIHFKVKAKGFRTLTTQMYFADENELNGRDGIYWSLTKSERKNVTALSSTLQLSTGPIEACQFDIVIAAT